MSTWATTVGGHRVLWIVAAGALTSGIVGAVWWSTRPAPTEYVTAVVGRGDVETTVVAAGIIQPAAWVDVGAQTSGKLKSLLVKRGDQVVADQVLAEIDPILASTALRSANAVLDNVTAQGAVKRAQLLLATSQRARTQMLIDRRLIAPADLDVAKANFEVADADVRALSALARQSTAAVATARANLSYTSITAPIAGEVVSITAIEGQTLNANQQAPNILRIADLDTVTVWAQVSEADIARVKTGQAVYFTVLGQARRWTGRVGQVLPTPELVNNAVFYDVLFDIDNADRALKIQMTAQIFIVIARAEQVLVVPAGAVGNAMAGTEIGVEVLNAGNLPEPRTLRIGIKSELAAEILGGAQEGDRVVVRATVEKPAARTKSALTARKGP